MKSYHRLTLIERSLRNDGLLAASKTFWRLFRDQVIGQHRLLFAMTGEKAAAKGVSDGTLKVTRFDTRTDMDADSRHFLSENSDKIKWDIEALLREGSAIWIGKYNGEVVTIAHTRAGPQVKLYFFPMTEWCALISHCLTTPKARGRGFYVMMLKYIQKSLSADGYKRIYIDCSDSNVSSERGILAAGFLLIGHGVHRRDGSFVWRQTTPPSVDVLEHQS